ncbi:MAG: ribbon-helix-helix protein, CopG family [Planctomycetes bacterium]|nr:ribbon-helix-helix protein, CopG family [Planctomycetota bacterium]
MSARITIRLDVELRKRLARLAQKKGKRESDIVREALEAHCAEIDKTPTCYELASRLGIIGVVKDAPRDLSTNPKHFEGFGR